jgi:hypothetical protein
MQRYRLFCERRASFVEAVPEMEKEGVVCEVWKSALKKGLKAPAPSALLGHPRQHHLPQVHSLKPGAAFSKARLPNRKSPQVPKVGKHPAPPEI